MDFDHMNGSSKHSRVDVDESDGSGSGKHSGRRLELVVGSRSSRHSSEGSGSSKHSSEESGSSKHSSEESGSSEHSRRHLELDDETERRNRSCEGSGSSERLSEGSGSSGHSRRHLELDHETGSSKHSSEGSGSGKQYPEVLNRSGENESNHFELNPEIIKGWGKNNSSEMHPEVIDGSESSKRSEVIQEEGDRNEGDILFSTEKLRLSSSSSPSSSGSSTDDQFQVDKKSRPGNTSTSSPKFDEDTEPSSKDKRNVSGNNFPKSEGWQNGSAGPKSTSQQVSSVSHESTSTQSPPIQVMDRQEEYDPYRIPSAVFARSKSTTPVDWSIASNESLFSIQVGNNSFSRDHILNLKSGELFKSGEFIAFSPSPVALTVDTQKKSVQLDKSKATVVSDDAVKDKTGLCVEDPIQEKPTHPTVTWNSSTISNHSDDSGTSGHSFAFQIRKKKKKKQRKCAWPSCYCSNCSWAFCYCTWPSCCFRWPSCCCSNCSWAFCCCWNCSIKRWCCHFSTVLTDGRNDGVKENVKQKQEQQTLDSAVPSKSGCCSCCTWFPSCQCGWHWRWCYSCNCCRGNSC
ncbi:PREDICTED: hornerin isoform X1 [Theobroma cacao]|uniref:Hornerin isoform X1 n=1 Tax=Theobroma cacao TaxID=3641 RepID=A0AB32VXN1_THECC|nr:PREDICTED: hornerin isoform X1 [Theobroma cacao]